MSKQATLTKEEVRMRMKSIMVQIDELANCGAKFTQKDCPLKPDHYTSSLILSGGTTYSWNCPLCGENFCD